MRQTGRSRNSVGIVRGLDRRSAPLEQARVSGATRAFRRTPIKFTTDMDGALRKQARQTWTDTDFPHPFVWLRVVECDLDPSPLALVVICRKATYSRIGDHERLPANYRGPAYPIMHRQARSMDQLGKTNRRGPHLRDSVSRLSVASNAAKIENQRVEDIRQNQGKTDPSSGLEEPRFWAIVKTDDRSASHDHGRHA